MQRLSNWFEGHLPLGRRSQSRRAQSSHPHQLKHSRRSRSNNVNRSDGIRHQTLHSSAKLPTHPYSHTVSIHAANTVNNNHSQLVEQRYRALCRSAAARSLAPPKQRPVLEELDMRNGNVGGGHPALVDLYEEQACRQASSPSPYGRSKFHHQLLPLSRNGPVSKAERNSNGTTISYDCYGCDGWGEAEGEEEMLLMTTSAYTPPSMLSSTTPGQFRYGGAALNAPSTSRRSGDTTAGAMTQSCYTASPYSIGQYTWGRNQGTGTARQSTIRTNPWVSGGTGGRSESRTRDGCNRTDAKTMLIRSSGSDSSKVTVGGEGTGGGGGKFLDESTFSQLSSSSGYGSHDSSPESSVHSPDWPGPGEPSGSAMVGERGGGMMRLAYPSVIGNGSPSAPERNDRNGRKEEHVYHELECLNRFSTPLDDGPLTRHNPSWAPYCGTPSPISDDDGLEMVDDEGDGSGASTPVYAVPFAVVPSGQREEPNSPDSTPLRQQAGAARKRWQEWSIRNSKNYFDFSSSPSSSSSSTSSLEEDCWGKDREEDCGDLNDTTSCSSWTPVVTAETEMKQQKSKFLAYGSPAAPNESLVTSALSGKLSEMDFLAELDQQIAELQLQSDAVRHLVEQAKERHEIRARTRQLCMEHLQELRKMRWVMHRNFELCL